MQQRKITQAELNQLKASFKLTIELLEGELSKCESCANWNGTGCMLASGNTPPKHVLEHGCASYSESEAPF